MQELIEDVELAFKLYEFSIRTMCYAELEYFDVERFGRDLGLDFKQENVLYGKGQFANVSEIIQASQMAVGTAFGATAICLDCLLENSGSVEPNLKVIKSLVSAVRNAFSHGIAAPRWFIKPHKVEVLDLSFISGPKIDLASLNGEIFDYAQIGGLAVWYRVKEYVLRST